MECVNPSRLLKNVNKNALNYDDVILAHGSVYGVYMITSCSQTWTQDDNSNTVRKKCETPDLSAAVSNALSVTPVSTPDVTYSNVYCAICNHQNVSDLTYWKVGLYCDDGVVGGDPFNGNVTLDTTLQHCSISFFQQPTVILQLLDPLRPCIYENFIDTCLSYDRLVNTSRALSREEYNCTAKQCKLYADYLYLALDLDTYQFFKNPDCAICNGVDVDKLSCVKLHALQGSCVFCTSFVAYLDFGNTGHSQVSFNSQVVTKSCEVGQVYNPGIQQCQNLVCPSLFQLVDNECKQTRTLVTFELYLHARTTSENLQQIISRNQSFHAFRNVLITNLNPFLANGTISELNISVINTTLHIKLVVDVINSNDVINKVRSDLTNSSFHFWFSGVYFYLSAVGVIPQLIELNCIAYIALNESEYLLLDNGSLLLTDSGKVLPPSELFAFNEKIHICNEFNQTYNRTVSVKTWNYNTAIILSVAASCALALSCCSLLVTYLLFKELRTLAGQCIMSYAFAIFISQIFFLFGPGLTGNSDVCTAMGVCLHYFSLCQFTWSSVLATDLGRTFVLDRGYVLKSNSGRKTFGLYSLYAWGAPLVICIIAVIVDQKTDVNITYQSARICWLQPAIALLVAFAIPVAVILAYNLVVFLVVSVSIYRSSKAGARARSEMNKGNSAISVIWRRFKVFAGTSSLLSLSWITAFLGALENLDWLWYLFAANVILQAILLFVIFVLNDKTRRLYGNLSTKKSDQGSSSRSQTATKTKHQTQLGTPVGSIESLDKIDSSRL